MNPDGNKIGDAIALRYGDNRLSQFADAVLRVYDQHDINGHIPWKK